MEENSLLEKIRQGLRGKKNIGLDLISLLEEPIVVSDLHKCAERELKKRMASYAKTAKIDEELVFISLCLIFLEKYDGGIYSYVAEQYNDLYALYSKVAIEEELKLIMKRFRKADIVRENERIINIPLVNTLVPVQFLASFFDFIYDIYEVNFFSTLSRNMVDDFSFVYEGIGAQINSSEDLFKLEVTNKSYMLIKTTKRMIERNVDIDVLIDLSVEVVRIIDAHRWGRKVNHCNRYLMEGYEAWKKKHPISDSGDESSEEKLRSKWTPRYECHDGHIYLLPPIHRVRSEDYSGLRISVLADNEEIYCDEKPYIRQIIGGYRIEGERIEIERPFNKIRYRLLDKDKIISDSKDILYRDYMIFSQSGRELRNGSSYCGVINICAPKTIPQIGEAYVRGDYWIGEKEVKQGDCLNFNDDIFKFRKVEKPGIQGKLIENTFLNEQDSESKILVYSNIEGINLESLHDNANFLISCNDTLQDLSHYTYTKHEDNGAYKYCIHLNITIPGIYTFKVWELSPKENKRRVLVETIAVDPDLSFSLEELEVGKYRAQINSSFIDTIMLKNIDANNFDENLIRFSWAGKNYFYMLPLPLPIYRVDGGAWTFICEDIWTPDVQASTEIEFYGEPVDCLEMIMDTGEIKEKIYASKNGFNSCFSLNCLRDEHLSDYLYLTLFVQRNGVNQFGVRCLNYCMIETGEMGIAFDEDDGLFCIETKYVGKGQLLLKVTNDDGDLLQEHTISSSNEVIEVANLPPFCNYRFTFYDVKLQGLLAAPKVKELMSFNKYVFCIRDLVGRVFKISKGIYQIWGEGSDSEYCEVEFLNHYIKITEQVDKRTFRGDIFRTKNRGGIYKLYVINPVDILVEDVVGEDTFKVDITKENDGLLYDRRYKSIMNSLLHETAPDFVSFGIDFKDRGFDAQDELY